MASMAFCLMFYLPQPPVRTAFFIRERWGREREERGRERRERQRDTERGRDLSIY